MAFSIPAPCLTRN